MALPALHLPLQGADLMLYGDSITESFRGTSVGMPAESYAENAAAWRDKMAGRRQVAVAGLGSGRRYWASSAAFQARVWPYTGSAHTPMQVIRIGDAVRHPLHPACQLPQGPGAGHQRRRDVAPAVAAAARRGPPGAAAGGGDLDDFHQRPLPPHPAAPCEPCTRRAAAGGGTMQAGRQPSDLGPPC
jgi:hypothetical protein